MKSKSQVWMLSSIFFPFFLPRGQQATCPDEFIRFRQTLKSVELWGTIEPSSQRMSRAITPTGTIYRYLQVVGSRTPELTTISEGDRCTIFKSHSLPPGCERNVRKRKERKKKSPQRKDHLRSSKFLAFILLYKLYTSTFLYL